LVFSHSQSNRLMRCHPTPGELTYIINLSRLLSRTTRSSLFPYTTLFRSQLVLPGDHLAAEGLFLLVGLPHRAEHVPPDDELVGRSEEHTSELQSRFDIVCRPLLEKKKI